MADPASIANALSEVYDVSDQTIRDRSVMVLHNGDYIHMSFDEAVEHTECYGDLDGFLEALNSMLEDEYGYR